MAIAAPHLQSQGVKQGIWFDLETMAPLMGTPAFKQATTIFVELASLMPPAEDRATCMTHNTPFLTGQCALTISWSYYLKVSASHACAARPPAPATCSDDARPPSTPCHLLPRHARSCLDPARSCQQLIDIVLAAAGLPYHADMLFVGQACHMLRCTTV
jgi:hypothetical protein